MITKRDVMLKSQKKGDHNDFFSFSLFPKCGGYVLCSMLFKLIKSELFIFQRNEDSCFT